MTYLKTTTYLVSVMYIEYIGVNTYNFRWAGMLDEVMPRPQSMIIDSFDMETFSFSSGTVKLGNMERFGKEQIRIKEPFPVTTLPFTS